jgi:hypothetical protein
MWPYAEPLTLSLVGGRVRRTCHRCILHVLMFKKVGKLSEKKWGAHAMLQPAVRDLPGCHAVTQTDRQKPVHQTLIRTPG